MAKQKAETPGHNREKNEKKFNTDVEEFWKMLDDWYKEISPIFKKDFDPSSGKFIIQRGQ